jgi:two-component system sensor histidine kinase TctE
LPTAHSLRRYLIAWIIGPIAVFVLVDTVSLYRSAMQSINMAYDRSLLASARSIGEQLRVEDGRLQVDLPYTALEIFDVGGTGSMAYRISGFKGEFVAGYQDLPAYTGRIPQRGRYPALIDFYDDTYRGEPVRMAALYQPVASADARGMALIQVAETSDVREQLTRQILTETLWRQALLIAVVALVTWRVVTRALRPVEALRQTLHARTDRDLSRLDTPGLPSELQPIVGAVNELMERLARLMGRQRQFVRDASHQLRTPLAVLKTQAQNGLRGHADALATLSDMHRTVDRAIRLSNQMLALAKVEQADVDSAPERVDLNEVAAEVCLDLAPLVVERGIEFELVSPDSPVRVRGNAWMLREVCRNLLHNAIRATPSGGSLMILIEAARAPDGRAWGQLTVRDTGPGIPPAQRKFLFEPFHTGHPTTGSGLGLAICRDVCERLGGEIALVNREQEGRVAGLDAVVRLPLADGADSSSGPLPPT